jgi:nitrite reductase/ring-hydroxylating ferredoxin subunit
MTMLNTKIINRRRFISGAVNWVGGVCLCSCASTGPQNSPAVFDAGPLSDYALDGESDRFAKSYGFLLSTFGGKLIALSSICSYRECIVKAAPGGDGFDCPCHGCHYDRWGSVRKGPAHNPLVHFVMSLNAARHVMVETTQPLIQPMWGRPDSYLIVR